MLRHFVVDIADRHDVAMLGGVAKSSFPLPPKPMQAKRMCSFGLVLFSAAAVLVQKPVPASAEVIKNSTATGLYRVASCDISRAGKEDGWQARQNAHSAL